MWNILEIITLVHTAFKIMFEDILEAMNLDFQALQQFFCG